ncbi:short-chain dehydrogenase [Atractiella rhizophila]|nr:short-chain dehydrogenase [Atractiella rhizophila]
MSTNNDFKLSNLFNVKGKVALVTGGGTGIGLMATQALAVNGAKVYIAGRRQDALERAAETHGQGIEGQIIPLPGDVNEKAGVQKLLNDFSSKENRLDILINNAGIDGETFNTDAEGAEEFKKALFDDKKATFDDWLSIYRTNVVGVYFTTLAFLPLLQKSSEEQHGWSSTVINISSISGIVKSAQHHFAYNASKGATIHLTNLLASEITSSNMKIRVNTIAPGVYPSEMTTNDSNEAQKSHIPKDKYEGKFPANRAGTDRDMGSAVLFAATNTYFNGQTLAVDGGYILETGRL